MGLLREQTRRFWTATLFLALGPVLIGLTVFRIIQRSGADVRSQYERTLACAVGRPVEIERLEYLSPHTARLVNVTFKESSQRGSFAFSPEIYILRLRDDNLLERFANSFEEYAAKCRFDLDESASESNSEATRRATLGVRSEDCPVVVIPQLFVKEDALNEVKTSFLFEFREFLSASVANSQERVVCLAANKLVFQSERDFDATMNARDLNAPRQTRRALIDAFRTAALLQPKTNDSSENHFTPNDIVAFSSESPIIENFRALYVHDHDCRRRRIDALFELAKLTSANPYYASLESTDSEDLRFTLSTNGEAIPGAFIARFAPFFKFLGVQGWMEGTVVASSGRKKSETTSDFDVGAVPTPASIEQSGLKLKDFHLCQFDLEGAAAELGFNALTGVVTDLLINEGIVQNGVIRCGGRIKMKRGTIPRKLVHSLYQTGLLEMAPPQAKSIRFINDATPFDALELHFQLQDEGFVLDSVYKNKIVAYYSQGDLKYGLYLPSDKAGTVESYPSLVAGLVSAEPENSVWTPLVKKAFVHLPVVKTARTNDGKSSLR